jgi:glycosyltransferase involved in cell wall biosynthesis
MKPELCLLYVHGDVIGYGCYGVELARALTAEGVEIYDRIDEPTAEELHPKSPRFVLEEEGKRRRHKKTNVAAWISTPSHARGWWEGQVPVISTMWEATRLPESFRENLHCFDTVIVPSDQNVELFGTYHPNVHKVPLGINTERWCYVPRQPPTTEFRFLIAGSGPRKGTDLAYRAFRAAFPEGSWGADEPVPVLIMKNPKNEDFWGPRIKVIPGRLSSEDEVSLYASAHCYLQPSRGEGFGLQPLQALAQGLPTILTDAHGHKDFAHLGIRLPWHYEEAAYFIYGDAGQWWCPNIDDLVDQMRWVYENWPYAFKVAESSAALVAWNWGWEHTARAFIDAVGIERLRTPYHGDRTWHEPESKIYKVMVKELWKADIGGRTMMFYPGTEYWEPADVKRILFEGGMLDPACLAMPGQYHFDDGLTEEQVAKVGGYKAEHEWCPTCRQRLGSSPTKADEIYAELQAR